MKLGTVVYQGKTKKDTSIIIRYPTEADIEEAMVFINTISMEQTFVTFQGHQLTIDEEKKYMLPFLEKIKKDLSIKLFVFKGNELIATSDITPQEKTSDHVGTFGLIVKKEYRREGIGKLLMVFTLQEVKRLKNIHIIDLGVFGDNGPAINLYKKMGFVVYGCLPKGVKHRDHYDEHILMYKLNE
jgi:RimJ/RimL family protein N-acetyltransferase